MNKKLKTFMNKFMNNAILGKAMENMKKHRDIEVLTTEAKRNYLVSELNYHKKKFFSEYLLVQEMKRKH